MRRSDSGRPARRSGASAFPALPAMPDFAAGPTAVPLELSVSARNIQQAGFLADADAMMAIKMGATFTHTAAQDGWFDDPATWGGSVPAADDVVLIPDGVNVWVQSDIEMTAGSLIWADGFFGVKEDATVRITVDTLMGDRSARFWIGDTTRPFTGQFNWEFPQSTIDVSADPRMQTKGIMFMGRSRVHGIEKTPWALTNGVAVGVGATSLTLASAPTGWNVGDIIAIPPTHLVRPTAWGNNPVSTPIHQTETRAITAIDGATVSWTTALIYDHTVNADSSFSDIHIVNQTRNIVFESPPGAAVHERGHVMMMFSDDHDWRYAEFAWLGRTDKRTLSWDFTDHPNHPSQGGSGVLATDSIKGRYSFHIHASGPDGANIWTEGLVCHDAFSLGIAIHNSNVDSLNCASVNMWGSGIFTESGNETGYIDGFVGIGHRTSRQDLSNKNDSDKQRHDWGHSQIIWMQGRLVPIRNCAAYGSSNGTGFVSNVRGDKSDKARPGSLTRRDLLPVFNSKYFFTSSAGESYQDAGSNTIVPIDVDGVRIVACLIGSMVIKAASQQDHYDYSNFSNIKCSNVIRAIYFEYTGRYFCDGLEAVYDEDGAAGFGEQFEIGIHIGIEAFQFTIKEPYAVGFVNAVKFDHLTVPVEDAIDRRLIPDADWHNIILGDVTGSASSDLVHAAFDTGANVDKDRYIALGELVNDASYPLFVGDRVDIPNTKAVFDATQVWDPVANDPTTMLRWSGTVTDSAGTYTVPAGRDLSRFDNPSLWGTLRDKDFSLQNGFWVEDGTGDIFTEMTMIVTDRCTRVRKDRILRVYFDHGAISNDPRPSPPVSPWITGPWVNNGTKA
ncbi:MAG TPA: G8 domain-containing protein [candidate division Zixibacteria bacterium]